MDDSINYFKEMYIRQEIQYQREKQQLWNNTVYCINSIKPYDQPKYLKTDDIFVTVYKKEMPKGGYFEGCTLELVTLNKNLI